MSWAKLDDGFHSHSKPLSCSLAAVGLYTVALSWSSAQETDGHIPAHMALHLARNDASLCDELVRSHLWEPNHDGYNVHDFLVFNPSSKSLEKKRKQHAKVMRSWRKRDRSPETHDGLPSTGRDGFSPQGSGSVRKRGGRGGRNATPLPEPWTMPDDLRQFAEAGGLDAALEWQRFKDWARSNGILKSDWPATFRNWCRNHDRFDRRPHATAR